MNEVTNYISLTNLIAKDYAALQRTDEGAPIHQSGYRKTNTRENEDNNKNKSPE